MNIVAKKIEDVIKEKTKLQQVIKGSDIEKSKIGSSKNPEVYSIFAQIKILSVILQSISTLIDQNEFLVAAEMLIFARHISTGLKLESYKSDMLKKLPVAKKQWDLLKSFFHIVKQQCSEILRKEELCSEEAAKSLCSLLILDNCGLEKVLHILIQTRVQTFLYMIEGDKYATIEEKIIASVKVLEKTSEIIFNCFIEQQDSDDNTGLLISELKKLTSEKSMPISHVLNIYDSSMYKTLPDVVSKFKPHIELKDLSESDFESAIKIFLNSIENIANLQLKDKIQLIASLKTIQNIKKQVFSMKKPNNWLIICRKLFTIDDMNFYDKFYQPLIKDKVQSIINMSWSKIYSESHQELESLILKNDRVHRDIKSYIWNNDNSDNPQSLRDALSTIKRSHRLLMKVYGYQTAMVEMCTKIDLDLEALFNDLKHYQYGSVGEACSSNYKRIKEVDEEHEKLINFLRKCSKENIIYFINYIKSSPLIQTTEHFILMARFFQSFVEICSNLQMCFTGHFLSSDTAFMDNFTINQELHDEWKEVKQLFTSESINFWQKWLQVFINEWEPLDTSVDLRTIVENFPCWETVNIEERDENDKVVQSQILVPAHLCISIQNWIYNVVGTLNQIIPHTLPKPILSQIVDSISTKLYQHYEAISKNELVAANQKLAWQFLFDLKVLMLIFTKRENKIIYNDYQELVNHFRNMIDPFDFDVFHQHVNANIKRNALRIQCEISNLLSNACEHLNLVNQNINISNSHERDPNIMMMSIASNNKINWFASLPIFTKPKETPIVVEEDKGGKRKVKKDLDIIFSDPQFLFLTTLSKNLI
jgi:conserved oligomeric Golgi complex subunit 1